MPRPRGVDRGVSARGGHTKLWRKTAARWWGELASRRAGCSPRHAAPSLQGGQKRHGQRMRCTLEALLVVLLVIIIVVVLVVVRAPLRPVDVLH